MPKKVISLEVLEKIADLYDHGYRGSQISKFFDIPVSANCVGAYTRAIKKLRSGQPLSLWETNHAVIFEYAKIHNLPEPKIAERKKTEKPEPVSFLEEPMTEDADYLQDFTQEEVDAVINHFDRNIIRANTKFIGDQLNRIADELEYFNQNLEKYLKGAYSHG